MRFKAGMIVLASCIAGINASGQIPTRSATGDLALRKSFPEDFITGERLGMKGAAMWTSEDAVGLQMRAKGKSPQSDVVSVKTLQISDAALKEMKKSDKALKAGDIRGSADHLEKMVEYAPDVAILHNSLGARYVTLQEYD